MKAHNTQQKTLRKSLLATGTAGDKINDTGITDLPKCPRCIAIQAGYHFD